MPPDETKTNEPTPPPEPTAAEVQPTQPPIDNAHVAPGAEHFSEPKGQSQEAQLLDAVAALPEALRDHPLAEAIREIVGEVEKWRDADAQRPRCMPPSGSDEPVYILRGQDALAVKTIEGWIEAARAAGVNEGKFIGALERRNEFSAWQAAHPNSVKLPD